MDKIRYCVFGLDLAGKPYRPSGGCVWQGSHIRTFLLYTDDEIMRYIEFYRPEVVAIDAPLSLPPGRQENGDRPETHFRECDLALRRRKIPLFPLTFGPMRELTRRGVTLKKKLEQLGFQVIEVYPGGAQDILGLPRAKKNRPALLAGLVKLGLAGLSPHCSIHELDAATGALVGMYFLKGEADIYGDATSGVIIMPPARER